MDRVGDHPLAALWFGSSLGRLIRGAWAVRRSSLIVALLVALAALFALASGGLAAVQVHAGLGDLAAPGRALAAICAAVVATELAAATLLAATRALLCLAQDIGPRRCDVLMALTTLLAAIVTAAIAWFWDYTAGALAAQAVFVVLIVLRPHFRRLYLRPDHPALRDFFADVLDLQLILSPRAGGTP